MTYFHAYQAYEHQREKGTFDACIKKGPSSHPRLLILLDEIGEGLIRAGSYLKTRSQDHPSAGGFSAVRRVNP